MKQLRALALAVCTVLLCACAPTDPGVIDGWPIGAKVPDCVGRTFTPSCDELIEAARVALDARDGMLHAPIASATLYYEQIGRGLTRTSGNTVAVFVLVDGSRRAIFVGSTPGGPITVDYGP